MPPASPSPSVSLPRELDPPDAAARGSAPPWAERQLRILLVEDNAPHAELVEHFLRDGGLSFRLERVETQEAFVAHLERQPPDMILSDYALPQFDGYTALAIAREKVPNVPFIFVTGTMGEEVAIETLKNGATDYVLKTRLARLGPAVQRALRESADRRERQRAEEKLRHSLEQLRALTNHLQHVREQERTRIAREVHDELGQALTGLKLDMSWLATRLAKNAKPVQQKVKTMTAHIDATIQTVRRIATELRPGILDGLGLVAAIEWQANEFQSRTGVPCHVVPNVPDTQWDQDFTTVFFRIFQETLTNIIRHAAATRVEVQLFEDHGALVLVVADNGRGVSEEEIASTRSIGLIGMRERAMLIGGEISLQGTPGLGTTVTLRVPLEGPRPSRHFPAEPPRTP
ncbi:MAG TPA: histidine kinase [Opitutaceae bacterium]|nr:histidine kinase [Opitutaceae bacterium]